TARGIPCNSWQSACVGTPCYSTKLVTAPGKRAHQRGKTHMRNLTILKASAAPIALGLALASTPAFAQTTESENIGVGPAEAVSDASPPPPVVVTGSRIRQPNLESASPVTVVGAEEVTQTGTT